VLDAAVLGGDLLLLLSMTWLVVSRGGRRDVGSLLDACLLALVAGVCGWALFAPSPLATGSAAARMVAIAYPAADLIALALLAGLLFIRPRAETGPSLPIRRALALGLGLVAVPVAMLVHRAIGAPDHDLADELALMVITAGIVLRGGLLVSELERLRDTVQQSERKFRLVFERAPIGISIGTGGMMSETNPALQRMLGYSSNEFAEMHYTDVTHPDDQDVKQQLELDAGTRDAFAIDKRYRRSDGSYIEAHVNVALDFEDGLGISLVEDVTGRRELEDQLRQAQKMDSIGKLAGGIAHDFNNLMTAVMGYSDLLLLDSAGADRDKVAAIRDSAVRASDLTRQLLAFSRRQILQTREIDLRDVVEKMDTLLRRVIGAEVRLQTLFGSEPVIVRADQTQLEQVVMNLAVNARDAMPGGGTLTIAVLTDGDTAVLSVMDDGVGMDRETQAQIFDPFFTTKPLAESSGLGLSTVHGIVGQSGGTLVVDSEPGLGATFTIRLPDARAPELPAAPAHATLID
jgi:PAS domain S-box-containing protein